jgi:ubiquinone/menaquinone biosynthesis C-methylase UbiE
LIAGDSEKGATTADQVSLIQVGKAQLKERDHEKAGPSRNQFHSDYEAAVELQSTRELWNEKRPTFTDFVMFLSDHLYNESIKEEATLVEESEVEEEDEDEANKEDDHPNTMYNWGIKWDRWWDDMMHLFPPKKNAKMYHTLNYGFVSEKLHQCVADVPAGEYLATPFNQTSGSNMYVELASRSPVSLKDKKVLEVSSGRGGGSAAVSDCFCPAEMIGLDFSPKQVEASQEYYGRESKCPLKFMHGDAMHLPFEDNSFDVVLNVEASHAYPSYRKFAKEAHRVLRPGGVLLTTDFRNVDDAELDKRILNDVFAKEVEPIDVSNQVLTALGENHMIAPFVAKCFETCKAKLLEYEDSPTESWELHRDGMGTRNPLGCAEMSGQFMQFSLGTGMFNYRMYILQK